MSSPWAKIERPEPVNLLEIMSEEVAMDLQAREYRLAGLAEQPGVPVEAVEEILQEQLVDSETESDALIAQLTQQQLDREYDGMVRKHEQKVNGNNKVSVSYINCLRAPQNSDFESEPEEEEPVDVVHRKHWDRFDSVLHEFDTMPVCGYKTVNGKIITKHDPALNGERNTCKMLSTFPPEFETGDVAGYDFKLSNKVYNCLKRHSTKIHGGRGSRQRDKREDLSRMNSVFDRNTVLILLSWLNEGLITDYGGIVSIGKEAVILDGSIDADCSGSAHRACVVKIFKTALTNFKQRDHYIRDDNRFRDRIGNQATRSFLNLWVEKEMRNLMRLTAAGIPCPEVIEHKDNLLVMSLIGTLGNVARKLKYARLSQEEFIDAYEQVKEAMKTMYEKANLIHADLSEYNILWWDGKCYFIDVSQSVEPSHENAFFYLYRDCGNITSFFDRKQVPNMLSHDELFEYVSGRTYSNYVELQILSEPKKMKPHLIHRPGMESTYPFDSAFAKAQK